MEVDPHLKTAHEKDSAANQQAWYYLEESIHARGAVLKFSFELGCLLYKRPCTVSISGLLCNFKQGVLGDSILRRRGYSFKLILWTLLIMSMSDFS